MHPQIQNLIDKIPIQNPKVKKAVVISVVVFLAVAIIKNPLIKTVVTVTASSVTGAPVHIDHMAVGVFRTAVRIKGFKMYNPKGFPKGVMLDIPTVSVDYNLPAILTGKLHFPLIVVDLKELVLTKNKDGVLSVDALKVSEAEGAPSDDKKAAPKKASKPMKMQIDVMTLSIGRVVYNDYSQGGDEPIVKVYEVGIKEKTYKNITSAEQFVSLILVESMKPTAIQGAKIYGAAAILGVGFLPAGVAGVLVGKSDASEEFNMKLGRVYDGSLKTLQRIGQIKSEEKGKGLIKARVDGSDVKVEVTQKTSRAVEVKVSARKFMIPKPEVAGGVLRQISQDLK